MPSVFKVLKTTMSKVAPVVNSSKKGYLLTAVKVTDLDKFKTYEPSKSVSKYGGKMLQKTMLKDAVYAENEDKYTAAVVLLFPTEQLALDWYNSEEYQKPKEVRQESSEGPFVIGEGLDMGDSKASLFAILKVNNPEAMANYNPTASIKTFQGTTLMKVGGQPKVSEGFEGSFSLAALVGFPTLSLASAWMASDEYKEMKDLRLASAKGPVAIGGSD